ncbi:short-chain dehydrogenase [Streptacidiphilus pinicola]|uniref:Short-chain dehydrogenase n=1 Tax=Streptacidiphilus pinicola TaxID=2219663 RepID=A0A2X0IP96_9ACTN|nr:SDR family NAD(P)-dependent oxidoreductase [Streptacidiphilus pinicola]RAG87052.1 short-chain dehydrogenase [Streptacidiphilus pinicola]
MSTDTFAFAGRTALVTGATNGLGLQTALRLARGGARVIVHGQTAQNTDTAVAALTELGAPGGRLEQAVADFRHLDQVRTLAEQLTEHHERLDLLVLNAGIAAPERRTLTEEGNELSFQVNYLAPYLLTRLLERPLARGTDTRVVALGSSLHRTANIDWTDLTRAKRYSRIAAYGQSKLALTTFISSLAPYLPAGHTAVTVHPGVAETATRPLYGTVGHPSGEVAETVVRLCEPGFEVVNGGYYEGLEIAPTGQQVSEKRSVDRLLKLSEKLTAAPEPAVSAV